jgi:hypothetical protein
MNDSIDWIRVLADNISGDLVVDNTGIRKTSHFSFEPDYEPSIGFDYGCFVQQKQINTNSSVKFSKSYRCLRFDENSFEAFNETDIAIKRQKEKMDEKNITYTSDEELINDIRDRYEVTAIFTLSDRMLYVLKDGPNILYSFGDGFLINRGVSEII